MSDDAVKNKIDMEARQLIEELRQINQTLKLGSVAREQREDHIYQRLYFLAEQIKHKHYQDKSLRELYYLITNDASLTTPPEVSKLPVYPDKYHMFTKFPTTPKTNIFLSQMAKTLHTMNPEQIHKRLVQPDQDGAKQVLESFVSHTHREHALKMGAKQTCKHCWEEVMRNIFIMTLEMLTLEMKSRAEQILQMTQKGDLTSEDAVELTQYITQVIHQMEKMLPESQKKKKTKGEWIQAIESLFQFMVNIINEIMMRYFQMIRMKSAIQKQDKLPVEFI
jgi:hypothetical protein